MPERILVLSSDADLAALLADALSLEGYGVTSAVYRDALPPVAEAIWDLLLFDYGGGAVPLGQAVLPAVQALVDRTACPMLVITTTPPVLAEAASWLAAQAVPLLPAPFPLDALLTLVGEQIARGQARIRASQESIYQSTHCIRRSQARITATDRRLARDAARRADARALPADEGDTLPP